MKSTPYYTIAIYLYSYGFLVAVLLIQRSIIFITTAWKYALVDPSGYQNIIRRITIPKLERNLNIAIYITDLANGAIWMQQK